MESGGPLAPEQQLEANLIEDLKVGREEAFERLVREHGPHMLAVTRRLLGNDDDAHEALQDALLSATRGIGTFQGDSKLSTWLHRVAANAALMKLRRRRSRPEVSIDELLPAFDSTGHRIEPRAPWQTPVEELLEQDEAHALVRARIENLPEDFRNVILLRDIEQMDTKQTAEILEISVPAVKTRLHRARQALRSLLEAELT